MTAKKSNGFVKVEHDLMDSPAWRTAPLGTRCVVLAVWRRHTGRNNGKIPYGRRDAQADLGNCGARQACRYVADAQERGFIEPTMRSSFSHKKRASMWRLTMEPSNGGPPTNEWANWTPPENLKHRSRSETRSRRSKFETQVSERHHNRCRSDTNAREQVSERHLSPLENRCRSDTTSKTKSSYQDEVLATAHDGVVAPPAAAPGPRARPRPLCPSELGRSDLQAAWLRSWLASGRLTLDEFASELGLLPQDVDLVASGARLLGKSDWQWLAALVAGRMH